MPEGLNQTLKHSDGTDLTLGSSTWDVLMLFESEARWEVGKAPQSAWWEPRLGGLPEDVRLDPERFAAKAAELLGSPISGSAPQVDPGGGAMP